MNSSTTNAAAINYSQDEIDFRRLLGYLIDGRWWIIGITAAFIFFSLTYALLSTPVYNANSLIQVEKKSVASSLFGSLGGIGEFVGGVSDAETEIELLRSRMILGATVDELKLDIVAEPDYFPVLGAAVARLSGKGAAEIKVAWLNVPEALTGEPMRLTLKDDNRYLLENDFDLSQEGKIGEPLNHEGIQLFIASAVGEPGQRFKLIKRTRTGAIDDLLRDFNVREKGKGTGILYLSLNGTNRAQIRDTLNNINENYLRQNIARKSEEAEKSLQFLGSQLPDIRNNLALSEEALSLFRQENDSVDLSLEAKSTLETMVQLEKQLNDLTFREAELQQLYTKRHPAYQTLIDKRQTLMNTKDSLNQSIQKLPKVQQEVLRLTRDMQVNQEIYVQLLNKQQELSIVKEGTIGNVRIIDDAVVQPRPIKPRKSLLVVIGTLAGIILSVGLVLLRASLHRGIKDPEELDKVGLPVYATVPLSKAQKQLSQKHVSQKHKRDDEALPLQERLLAVSNPADLAMESLRSLRTSLYFATVEAKNNIVMITGANIGIGKSFVSSNFAATLAMGDKRILMIDADLRKGYMHHILGRLPRAAGLSAYLGGQADKEAIIQSTELPNLDFVFRGEVRPNPSELLMHSRFNELLRWAGEKYDFVLIDTPPVLAVTDAAIIGGYAGTTILVTRFAQTSLKEVEIVQKRLAQNGITIKGIVLNGIERKASSYNYYYYDYGVEKV